MKIGVLSDIHGNSTALKAVIKEAEAQGVEVYILLGDLFAKGPSPQAVYEVIKSLKVIASIRGNTEDWFFKSAITQRQQKLAEYGKKELTKEGLLYINQLAYEKQLQLEGHQLYLMHEYTSVKMLPEKGLILFGHTHQPIKEKTLRAVNPGSVGMPYDGNPLASYGILEVGKSLNFFVQRVSYDVEKEKELAKAKQLPFLETYQKNIETGVKND